MAKLTLHIDDEGATGEGSELDSLITGLTIRFGDLKVQRAGKDHDWSTPFVYTHIGHEYGQSWGADGRTTVTDSQEFYTSTLEPIAIPSGSRTRGLTEAEFGDLRILNGEMGYGKDCRPDAMGRVGFSQQNVDKDAVVQHLIEANEALKVL